MPIALRPLLFDRLRTALPDAARPGWRDPRSSVIEALEASVAEQLEWLLNTRAAAAAEVLDARTQAGTRSTLDYGLPDLTFYPIGNAEAMGRLARHLREAIARYEPRITDPHVALEPADQRDALIVLVSGDLHHGAGRHAVRLRFPIRVEPGSRHAG